MSNLRKQLTALTAAVTLALPLSVMATNGMNPDGTGTKNRGMGGAGLAMTNETAAVTTNPATVVDVGDRWDVALGWFNPEPRGYTLAGNGAGFSNSQESDSNNFFIPFFGMSMPIDNKSSWAFVVNANGGMNVDYKTNFHPGLPGRTSQNLEQLFLTGTYGYKVTDTVSLGITGIYAYQSFEAKGLGAFKGASEDSTALSDNGEDTSDGFGYKLGVRAELGNGLSIGAAYQPKIEMGKFSKYKGLFPNQGQMDIAATYGIGLAWVASPALTVAFDYVYIDYEDVAAIGNSTKNFTEKGKPFGSTDGPGFGWKSINVYKLGAQYQLNNDLALRVGWNHGENPIESDEVSVNFLAPGVTEDHLTLGGTYNLAKDSELNFSYVKSFSNSVTGPFATAFGGGTMTIEMEQQYFEMGYAKHF